MGGEAAPLLAVRPALADDEVRALRERVLFFSLGLSFSSALFFAMRTDYTVRCLKAGDPATIGVTAIIAYYCCHAVSNPILGKLSDRIGRKPLLLTGCGATIVVFGACAAIAETYLFLALFAFLGAADASNVAYHLMVVDTVAVPLRSNGDGDGVFGFFARRAGIDDPRAFLDDPQRRLGVIFSAVYVCSMMSAVLGFAAAIILQGAIGIRGTIGVAAGIAAPLFCFVFAFQPETAPPAPDRGPISLADAAAAVVREQLRGLGLLVATERRRWLLLAAFAEHAAVAGSVSIVIYWCVFKFGFGVATQTGVLVVGLVSGGLGTVLLQGVLIPSSGLDGPRACVALGLFASLAAAVLAAAFEPWMAFVGMLAVGSAGMNPEIRSLLTADVDARDQGYLQGALQTVNSVGDAIGAALVLLVFSESTDDDSVHDTHRSRHMLKANTIWHLVLGLNAVVVFALLQVETRPAAQTAVRIDKARDSALAF